MPNTKHNLMTKFPSVFVCEHMHLSNKDSVQMVWRYNEYMQQCQATCTEVYPNSDLNQYKLTFIYIFPKNVIPFWKTQCCFWYTLRCDNRFLMIDDAIRVILNASHEFHPQTRDCEPAKRIQADAQGDYRRRKPVLNDCTPVGVCHKRLVMEKTGKRLAVCFDAYALWLTINCNNKILIILFKPKTCYVCYKAVTLLLSNAINVRYYTHSHIGFV